MQKTLSAFNNKVEEKEIQLSNLDKWFKGKNVVRTTEEIVEELFSQHRTFERSDCVLEHYDSYPEELGLPLWLGYVNRTIYHHKHFSDFERDSFEFSYYVKFILSCRRGVDYSKMLHAWQIHLLKGLEIGKEFEDNALDEIIGLHKRALSGERVDDQLWVNAQASLEKVMDSTNDRKDVKYHLRRTAYLSVEEVIGIENLWTSSIEAAVDAKVKAFQGALPESAAEVIEYRKVVWRNLMDVLLSMLKGWK